MPTIQLQGSLDELAPIMASLEQCLSELDMLGTGIAAAHLDAAIHQLKRDQAQIHGRL
ncbi:MAG: hypothetical protein ABJ311_01105 [Erythrobacter sp.]